MVAMVIAIILGVLLAPLQLSKPNAVLKINQDREVVINAARTELMLSKTQKEMSYRMSGANPSQRVYTKEEETKIQAYKEHISRFRGINLLEEYPVKGTAGNKTLMQMKIKEKPKVKSKTKSLSESFKKGIGSLSNDKENVDEEEK